MNTLTSPQLVTITKLAECYFEKHFPPKEDNFHFMVSWRKARKLYVEAIIDGLTDPTLWGK